MMTATVRSTVSGEMLILYQSLPNRLLWADLQLLRVYTGYTKHKESTKGNSRPM